MCETETNPACLAGNYYLEISMQLTILDGRDEEVTRMELIVGIHQFTITDDSGELKIHCDTGALVIKPESAYEIVISSQSE